MHSDGSDGGTPRHHRPRRRGRVVPPDLLAAAGFAGLTVLTALAPVAARGHPPGWLVAAVAAASAGPPAARRSSPLPACCASLAVAVAAWPLGWGAAGFAAVAYTLYPVALTRPRRDLAAAVVAAALAGGPLCLAAAGLVGDAPLHPRTLGFAVLLPAAAWVAGRLVRDRRLAAARAAEDLALRAVAGERLRVARELHDVVTHSIGLIAVKASVANHVAAERPAEVVESLRAIESISREALAELRGMLRLLRVDTGAPADPSPGPRNLDPAPGVAGLGTLADRVRAAGVAVELTTSGLDDVPAGVGLSVYRIAQESLTNVVKHAGVAACRVDVEADGTDVRIEVTDDGRAVRDRAAKPAGGHGLVGMRERAAMYGGVLDAGPTAGGGYRVMARLPYAPAPEDGVRSGAPGP
ncbi:sensor histidine kinase [Streptomyces sp. WMMC500]|uniref:sensor histidine kinase n=1 Tax=Streptomyces sp. WMMC500 TaxID=3015154 RepID=UPI00248AB21F|nr:sensor histidine kinase [Streptomyces sp. WMMC500]WBB62179.1 sensor histidine kinase [Streptomyces sp. WMMC500]